MFTPCRLVLAVTRLVIRLVMTGVTMAVMTACHTQLERIEQEQAHPLASIPPALPPARVAVWREPFANADFEAKGLSQWFVQAGAAWIPVADGARKAFPAKTMLTSQLPGCVWKPPELGGDYWDVPVQVHQPDERVPPMRQTGAYWLEPPAGRVVSPSFHLRTEDRFLTFLARPRTSLSAVLIDDTGAVVAKFPVISPSAQLKPVVFDLAALPPAAGSPALRIRFDTAPGDALDSFILWNEKADPQSLLGPDEAMALDGVWGAVDLHAHLMNHMGFGGHLISGSLHSSIGPKGLIAGKAESPSDPEEALRPCHPDHGSDATGSRTAGVLPEGVHDAGGYPDFDGWPHYWTLIHQQAYVEWLHRAFDGGIRIINVDAGNSQILATVFGTANATARVAGDLNPTDDAWAVEHELQAIHDFVKLPDVKDWVQIATSSAEARRIVRAGKLAIVLGLEVDDMGNLSDSLKAMASGDQRRLIDKYLDWLVANDVRHVLPIHVVENAFGAPAAYEFLFDLDNYFGTNQEFYPLRDGFTEGIRFRMDLSGEEYLQGNGFGAFKFLVPQLLHGTNGADDARQSFAAYHPYGSAHRYGLTSIGLILVQEAMRRGLILDVDHMSDRSAEMTIQLAQGAHYPLISSHTGFRTLAFGSWKLEKGTAENATWVPNRDRPLSTTPHDNEPLGANESDLMAKERDRSDVDIEAIRALGGMVGVGTGAGAIPVMHPYGGSRVLQNCDGSSTVFAQELLYAIEMMKAKRSPAEGTLPEGGVGIGTDVNGLNGLANPRFGLNACRVTTHDAIRGRTTWSQVDAQRNPVAYKRDLGTDPATGINRVLSTVGRERLEGPPNEARSSAFDDDEVKAWGGIARWRSGYEQEPGISFDTDTHDHDILNLAWGLFLGTDKVGARSPRPVGGDMHVRAGWDLAAGELFQHDEGGTLKSFEQKLARMWTLWQRMANGHGAPLTKSKTGNADFDLNIDGLAHYGLLPDFFQDVRNVGVAPTELATLFHGAQDYIDMWATIEARAQALGRSTP